MGGSRCSVGRAAPLWCQPITSQLYEVIHHLETQHKRLRKLIGELSEEQLDIQSASNPKRSIRRRSCTGCTTRHATAARCTCWASCKWLRRKAPAKGLDDRSRINLPSPKRWRLKRNRLSLVSSVSLFPPDEVRERSQKSTERSTEQCPVNDSFHMVVCEYESNTNDDPPDQCPPDHHPAGRSNEASSYAAKNGCNASYDQRIVCIRWVRTVNE